MWYLVLSERIDAHVALKAALGWGADAYTDATRGRRARASRCTTGARPAATTPR